MSDFKKNCVKLLPNIYNSENNVLFYTEFDGMFDVGDKLYIMVNNNGTLFSNEYYKLDSYHNSGSTQNKNGYTLLKKEGNSIVLDINYDELILTLSKLTVDCYISRIYMKNTEINNATINGVSIYDAKFSVTNTLNLKWKQGVIFKVSGDTIENIDFKNKYTDDFLILKSQINEYGNVESFYTKNNYGIGLTVVNLIGPRITLINCNIQSGTFYSCNILSPNIITIINYIYGGFLVDCYIGDINNPITADKITVDGGYLYNCVVTNSIFSNMIWLNGTWYNDWSGITNNPFNFTEWNNGTWKYGIFPEKVWKNGRFMDGEFRGSYWYGGIFNGGIFNNGEWFIGTFNGGLMSGLHWYNGTFNGGTIENITWYDGTFNGGEMINCNWVNGVVNYGNIKTTHWTGGTFNDGIISGCTWYNGVFKGGTITNSTWYNGTYHNGTFTDSTWHNGKFYNGSIFNSIWYDGQMFFGTVNGLDWSDGIWYDGIANDIIFNNGMWYNGIFNAGTFNNGVWYDGSFNNGIFGISGGYNPVWNNGIFYFGQFCGDWKNGTFYNGLIVSPSIIPPKDYIGKDFVPYNKNGLITKPRITPRKPKITNIVSTTITDAKTTVIRKDRLTNTN